MIPSSCVKKLIQFATKIFFVMVVLHPQCFADDSSLSTYLGNLYLLESRQIASPNNVFQYTNPENGELLKTVLSPSQFELAIQSYTDKKMHREDVQNLPSLLNPILTRYEKAFIANPKLYEAEYLDTLEIGGVLVNSSSGTSNQLNSLSATANQNNQEMNESLKKLNESMAKFLSNVKNMYADSIRKKISDNLFTPEGALRATKIANSISLPSCSQKMIDDWEVKALDYVRKNSQYPMIAKLRGWQGNGTTKLVLNPGESTNTSTCDVKISTGTKLLDSTMIETCQRIDVTALQCSIPQGKKIIVELPFKFELKEVKSNPNDSI